jgi:hypothetical protein
LALVLIILITSINFISLRKEKRSMDVTVNSKGIPEHGLFLIGPTESLFEKNLSAAQRERSSEFSQSAKLLSAVVMNSTQRSVVAYHLKWNLVYLSGKAVSHERSYADPTLLMENARKRGQNPEGNSIGPESTRLVSLVPFLSDSQSHGSIGGVFLQPVPAAGIDSVKRAFQDQNPGELMNHLSENLNQVAGVEVALDGAFFDDGTFVGPDESQFFSKLKAQVDARHDLYKHIQKMFTAMKPPQRILQYVTDLANKPRIHLRGDSSPNQFYAFFTKFYAQEISRIWSKSGQESVSHFVQRAISEPWPSLKKG